MHDALSDFKETRKELRRDYDRLQSSPDGKEKDTSMGLIYKQLRMLRNQLQSQLPIISKKRELFDCLKKSNLVILEGETGSGKSTQLPQMLC